MATQTVREKHFEQLVRSEKQQPHLFKLLVDSKWSQISEEDRSNYNRFYKNETEQSSFKSVLKASVFAGLYYAVDRKVKTVCRQRVLFATGALITTLAVFNISRNNIQYHSNLREIYGKYNFAQSSEALQILKSRIN